MASTLAAARGAHRRPAGSFRNSRVPAQWLALAVLAGATSGAALAAAAAPARLTLVADAPLPAGIDWAFDVRWASPGSVVVAAGRAGVFEVPVGKTARAPRQLPGSEAVGHATRVAVSGKRVAAAAPFGTLAWQPREGGPAWRSEAPMNVVVDFDVVGDRVLLLGGRRLHVPGEPKPQWAPEGGILFGGSLANGGALEILLTARSGRHGRALEMARCHILDLGAVRFLADGRSVVVPGVQPGIFVYAADGRLLHAWSSTEIGLYDDCDLDEREMTQIGADIELRIGWWQRHEVLDDIVPWGDGFALLIRAPQRDGARWRLVPYGPAGRLPEIALPWTADAPGIHLRGDVRDGRLVLLAFDHQETDGSPRHRPRLLLFEPSHP